MFKDLKVGDYLYILNGFKVSKEKIKKIEEYKTFIVFVTKIEEFSIEKDELEETFFNYDERTFYPNKSLIKDYLESQIWQIQNSLMEL